MTDENKLIRQAGRAVRARQLLENEMLTEAFETLEKTYTQAWKVTHVADVDARERLFLAVNLVGKIRDHLKIVVMDGKIAEAELKQLAFLAERKKRRGIK